MFDFSLLISDNFDEVISSFRFDIIFIITVVVAMMMVLLASWLLFSFVIHIITIKPALPSRIRVERIEGTSPKFLISQRMQMLLEQLGHVHTRLWLL